MKIFLESQRLYLREIAESDLQLLFELHSDPDVMQFIRPVEKTIDETQVTLKRILSTNKYEHGFGLWVCCLKSTDEFIGWFVLKNLDKTEDIEIGYRLLRKCWGNGYATEMSRELLKYGFEKLNLDKIVGATRSDNVPSQHVLEKIGFKFEGIQHVYNTDAWIYWCLNPMKA
ncbi:GNAT family N-acetyltransferase [soil metagenome]